MQVSNEEIMGALKTALKSRGVRYKDLAVHLGVSEKTVKRLFNDGDCALSRLKSICEYINISLSELISFAEQYKAPLLQLSAEQETFLAQHPYHFNYLFLLSLGYSAQQIQQKYQLSELSTFRYLKLLDGKGFLELTANNRYRLLVKGKLLLKLHGALHEKIKVENQRFVAHVIDNHGKGCTRFGSAYRFMSKETLLELNKDIESLFEKYIKLSQRDEAVLTREKLMPVKWASQVAPFEIFGVWEIKALDNA